jgi:hypothetical protein
LFAGIVIDWPAITHASTAGVAVYGRHSESLDVSILRAFKVSVCDGAEIHTWT